MSENATGRSTPEPGSLRQGYLVNPRVEPGSSEAMEMTAGSGRRLSRQWQPSGPAGCCVKILLESTTWGSEISLMSWKHFHTKSRHRLGFRLVPSTPRTGECATGFWPTPRKSDAEKCSGPHRGNPDTLSSALKAFWQTPARHQFEKRRQAGQTEREELLLPGQLKAFAGSNAESPTGASSGGPCPIAFRAWMMGYPLEYAMHWLPPSATP